MPVKNFSCPNCGTPLPDTTRTNELFKCPACNATLFLTDWKIGDTDGAAAVATGTRVYIVTDHLSEDDLCSVYRATFTADGKEWQSMFRIARDADDNDLVQNEARTLYYFQSLGNYGDFHAFLPSVLESFLYQDTSSAPARQVNILSLHEQIASPGELYSLEEVRAYYPGGIHAKDMAWMWRRLLNVLGFAHANGVIHGAVLPPHVLIEPKDHKLALTGWGFAVRNAAATGIHLPAMSMTFEDWYPPEVAAKQVPLPGLDLFMAVRTMLYLIGADPLGSATQPSLEPELQQYFARCLEAAPEKRPQDAWTLLDEFDRVIEHLWGPRQFRPFSMPAKS